MLEMTASIGRERFRIHAKQNYYIRTLCKQMVCSSFCELRKGFCEAVLEIG